MRSSVGSNLPMPYHVKSSRTAISIPKAKTKEIHFNLTRKTFSTRAMLFPKMVPSWSPMPASRKPKSGIPKMAYKIQKIFPPSVLGATFPYPVERNRKKAYLPACSEGTHMRVQMLNNDA